MGKLVINKTVNGYQTIDLQNRPISNIYISIGGSQGGTGRDIDVLSSITTDNLFIFGSSFGVKNIVFYGDITLTNFVAASNGSFNSIYLSSDDGNRDMFFREGGSSYGENVVINQDSIFANNVDYSSDYIVPKYIGATSSSVAGTYGWLYENPPKIDTFTDSLTQSPSTNSNWSTYTDGTTYNLPTLTNTGNAGGGYNFSGSSNVGMISTDTFDLIGSNIVFQFPEAVSSSLLIWYIVENMLSISGTVNSSYVDVIYENMQDLFSASTVDGPP